MPAVDIGYLYRLKFVGVNNYAWANNLVGSFPNFHHADYGDGEVNGVIILNSSAAEWRDVPAVELGDPPADDMPARFRATNDWASSRGFAGGFPNFHEADYGNGTVYGTILLKSDAVEWRDVPATELGDPPDRDIAARFTATNDWAASHGFVGGFPNFHEADYGNGRVYGTILLKPGKAQWADVLSDVLLLCAQFQFDSAITSQQIQRLLQRHMFARTRVGSCGTLSPKEKADLIAAYRRRIWHGVNTDANANASAEVDGTRIWVNFSNLFPLGNDEIAQTLIHEMMHCSGYRHPSKSGNPGDSGPYYGSPPLQAEICIAGAQSLVSAEDPRECVEHNGVFTMNVRR